MMWKISEIDRSKSYCLQLCEDDGLRTFVLTEATIPKLPTCVFRTRPIPINLVLSRNLGKIAKEVRLENGEEFGFEAETVCWMTIKEADDFCKNPGEIPYYLLRRSVRNKSE